MSFVRLVTSPLLLLTFIVYAFMSNNHFLLQIPTVGLLRRVTCNNRQPALKEDEAGCKKAQDQERLAYLMGWKICFDTLPGYLLLTATCKEGANC